MVAVIKAGHSLHRIFNYNENKVREGVAEIIGGENYPFDPDQMTVNMRLNRLLKQTELRPDKGQQRAYFAQFSSVREPLG